MCGGNNNTKTLAQEQADVAAVAAAQAAADAKAAAAKASAAATTAGGVAVINPGLLPFINGTNATYSNGVATLNLPSTKLAFTTIETNTSGKKFSLNFGFPTATPALPRIIMFGIGGNKTPPVVNDKNAVGYSCTLTSTTIKFNHAIVTDTKKSNSIPIVPTDTFKIVSDGINVSYYKNGIVVFGPLPLDTLCASYSSVFLIAGAAAATTVTIPITFTDTAVAAAAPAAAGVNSPLAAKHGRISISSNDTTNPKVTNAQLINKAAATSTITTSEPISLNGNNISMTFVIGQLSPTSTSGVTNFGFQFGLPVANGAAAPTPPFAAALTPFYASIGYDGTLTLNGATTTPVLPTAKLVVGATFSYTITSSSAIIKLNTITYTINIGTGPYVPGNVGCSIALSGTGATGPNSVDMIFDNFTPVSTIKYIDTPITFPSRTNFTTVNPILVSSDPGTWSSLAGSLVLATSATPAKTISPSITLVPNARLTLYTLCSSLGDNATVGSLYFGFTCGSDSVILSISYNGSVSLIDSTNSTTDWTTTPALPPNINANDSFSILITPNAVTIQMTINSGSTNGGNSTGVYTLNFKNVPYVPGNVSCNFFTDGVKINGNIGMAFKPFTITSSVQDVKVISGFQNPTNTKNSYSFQGYYPPNKLTGMDYQPF